MRVFISWSGPQSRAIAEAFHAFIGDCIQGVKPFVSSHDIDAGANWPDVLRTELKTTGFGVLCLTTENLFKPWILFEAGAISNALDKGIVCPYLFGLKPTDLQWPLAQFNANVADADDSTGTHKVVRSINTAMGAAGLHTNSLDRQFRRCWPEYQEALKRVPAATEKKEEERRPTFDTQKALEEILAAVRERPDVPQGRRMGAGLASLLNPVAKRDSDEITLEFRDGPLDELELSLDPTTSAISMSIPTGVRIRDEFDLNGMIRAIIEATDELTIDKDFIVSQDEEKVAISTVRKPIAYFPGRLLPHAFKARYRLTKSIHRHFVATYNPQRTKAQVDVQR